METQMIIQGYYMVSYKYGDIHTGDPCAFYFANSEQEAVGKFHDEFVGESKLFKTCPELKTKTIYKPKIKK